MRSFPVGKLPPHALKGWLEKFDSCDERIVLGPGIGLDCAVLDFGSTYLVAKSDPITFTTQDIGWYAVHINANDIATTGAKPRWFLCTLLLPEHGSTQPSVNAIMEQVQLACSQLGVSVVGGHSEVTSGLNRPILSGTMLGEVRREALITPRGAKPGDDVLLTKGVPIEAASILAREYARDLKHLPASVLQQARAFLKEPGISVLPEAQAAVAAGGVSAMHDPTEGGLASALWELSQAAQAGITIDPKAVLIPPEAGLLCDALSVDPLCAISSGALLLTCRPERTQAIMDAIEGIGVQAGVIGQVVAGDKVQIIQEDGEIPLIYPKRDALSTLFERMPPSSH